MATRARRQSIATQLIESGKTSGRTAGRSAEFFERILDTGILGDKADSLLRSASLGMMGYRWASEQAAANLSFAIRIASARDPFTVARLQGECLTEAWERWGTYVAGATRIAPTTPGKTG